MCLNNPSVLITAEINKSLLDEMILKGIEVDVIPFIQTQIIRTKQLQTQIENVLTRNATVVFSSKNAVEAVAECIRTKKPIWKVYCIGKTTSSLVKQFFGEDVVTVTADNAITLAERIILNKEQEVYFFCGDKRRDELPDLLKQNNILVNEIEVYTTTILQHKLEKDYNAVLFFSPSALQGFFKKNSVKDGAVLFAIGNTTAEEIKKFSSNMIIVSDKPNKKELIEKTIGFFSNSI